MNEEGAPAGVAPGFEAQWSFSFKKATNHSQHAPSSQARRGCQLACRALPQSGMPRKGGSETLAWPGLSLNVWTASTPRAVRVAKHITSDAALINATSASDARLPFGGTKKSG